MTDSKENPQERGNWYLVKDGVYYERRIEQGNPMEFMIKPWGRGVFASLVLPSGPKPFKPDRKFIIRNAAPPNSKMQKAMDQKIPVDIYVAAHFHNYAVSSLYINIPVTPTAGNHSVIHIYLNETFRWSSALAFNFLIPPWALERVSKYEEGNWEVLKLFNRLGALATQAFDANPAVLFMLAHTRPLACRLKVNKKLFEQPHKQIATALGFPSGKSAVKILKRLSFQMITVDNLKIIRQLLNIECKAKLLSHARVIDALTLHILTSGFNPVFERYLMGLKATGRGSSVRYCFSLYKDSIKMAGELVKLKPDLAGLIPGLEPVVVTSKKMLKEKLHDVILDLYLKFSNVKTIKRYSCPPLPGVEGYIEPITSYQRLVQEGKAMSNCIASYDDSILDGSSYIYHMVTPPCTIQLLKKASVWRIGEVRGRFNNNPGPGVMNEIRKWFTEEGARKWGAKAPVPPRPQRALHGVVPPRLQALTREEAASNVPVSAQESKRLLAEIRSRLYLEGTEREASYGGRAMA